MQPVARPLVLIVEDDPAVQISLALLLKQAGYSTLLADDAATALALLTQHPVQLVVQDMNFSLQTSGEEGLALLEQIRQHWPMLPVLLMTAWGSIALAVRGMKLGAADFFTKPWDNQQLLELIQTTLELATPVSAPLTGRAQLDSQYDFSALIGEHPEFVRQLATIARVARTKAPVLIYGESGTGKELVADAIHRNSPRQLQPLVKVNMGAVTSSLFESEMFGHVRGAFTDAKVNRAGHIASASQGTLFLDEIGELQKTDQVKLLRVLQEQRYQPVGASQSEQADFRLVSATNQDLSQLVSSGLFREDLLYRLNLICIRLPPLRERRSDIPLLAKALLLQLARDYQLPGVQLTQGASDWLYAQPWPGNIRQLKQTLERTLLLASAEGDKQQLDQQDFISAMTDPAPTGATTTMHGRTLDEVEKQLIEQALAQFQGNLSRVAKQLGLSRTALYRRLEKHQLSVQRDEP
ncbi:sigma-54-dependent transcriptional regulator [Rheinheimera riviphila]|uniref:sigma-54-dependent transcriptional regulator n=1 Tax=Rheinheimera riviphila TaxID=1834037 RepID=UPI001980D826|nr:sigma-54 dependent transcriptional regulator [Rheinheimera riviphila]